MHAVPQQSSSEPASYPDYCEPLDFPSSPPCSPAISPPCSPAISPYIPEKACTPQHSAPSPPGSPPSVLVANLDSTTFWKVCNEAGCTQGIFSEFIREMTGVSHRIQSDEASQEGKYKSSHTRILTTQHLHFKTLGGFHQSKHSFLLSTDYDLALKVMVASGKLAALVTKQQRGEVDVFMYNQHLKYEMLQNERVSWFF